jgi:hypothetical protein
VPPAAGQTPCIAIATRVGGVCLRAALSRERRRAIRRSRRASIWRAARRRASVRPSSGRQSRPSAQTAAPRTAGAPESSAAAAAPIKSRSPELPIAIMTLRARIEPIGRREDPRRTDVETCAARTAMVPFGGIGRQVDIAEDRAQKQPGAEFPAHQIGVLALPSDTGRRRQGFSMTGAVSTKILTSAPSPAAATSQPASVFNRPF